MKDEQVTLETEEHPFSNVPFRSGPGPSYKAIALAFWGRAHCQFHDASECGLIEEIISDAERIDRGEPSEYIAEHGPGMRDGNGKLIEKP